MVGDVIGAVVEGESPGYIRKSYPSVEEMLKETEIPEFVGPPWKVGRYTDDTQMMICVAEWLIHDASLSPLELLRRFSRAYERFRRYGSGTERILQLVDQYAEEWRSLSTMMFPDGSYGNGSAMRVAPVGLLFHRDFGGLVAAAMASSRTTHSHSLAYQAVVIQSSAVAAAIRMEQFDTPMFLRALRLALTTMGDRGQDTTRFSAALALVEDGLRNGTRLEKMADKLGTGIAAVESVPMAVFCFLRNARSFETAIRDAVFAGGDTDTIAAMTGAIAGAHLGEESIPGHWLAKVREEKYGPAGIRQLADSLLQVHKQRTSPADKKA